MSFRERILHLISFEMRIRSPRTFVNSKNAWNDRSGGAAPLPVGAHGHATHDPRGLVQGLCISRPRGARPPRTSAARRGAAGTWLLMNMISTSTSPARAMFCTGRGAPDLTRTCARYRRRCKSGFKIDVKRSAQRPPRGPSIPIRPLQSHARRPLSPGHRARPPS